MSPTDELIPLLKKLKLSGILETLELRINQAIEDKLAHPEFLFRIFSDEVERRESKMLTTRIRQAKFEHAKTIEDFDFCFNPHVPKAKVIDLATCSFVAKKRNLLLIGNTGVGKSHIAQAIGHRACRQGHKVLFVSAQDLLRQLHAARGDGSYEKCLARLLLPQLLIIDDLALQPLVGNEPIDLYEIIRIRYERGSCLITSNRSAKELTEAFGDPLIASAAMDRLLHDAEIVVMEGDSYRNPPPKKRPQRRKKAAA